jgi:peptidoglycan/LPS O-acetylase OafA/YrhL
MYLMIHGVGNNKAGDGETLDQTEVPGRKLAFDYLRAFAVTLVLYHHAIHAYTTFVFINFENSRGQTLIIAL